MNKSIAAPLTAPSDPDASPRREGKGGAASLSGAEIERARAFVSLPLSNADRKRLYLIRLIRSAQWDEHEHSRRVAAGLSALRRLHQHWLRQAAKRALKALPQRPVLTLESRRTA